MKNLLKILTVSLFTLSFSISAQESSDNRTGFISDDLFIYFHSGAGTEYRILGSISAGEEVQVLSDVKNGYIHIMDPNNREGWIDASYLSDQPGLRDVVAELNNKLADQTVDIVSYQEQVSSAQTQLRTLKSQNQELIEANQSLTAINDELNIQVDDEALQVMVTWFSYGGGVLVIGLLLGLLLPRFIQRKSNYSSWG